MWRIDATAVARGAVEKACLRSQTHRVCKRPRQSPWSRRHPGRPLPARQTSRSGPAGCAQKQAAATSPVLIPAVHTGLVSPPVLPPASSRRGGGIATTTAAAAAATKRQAHQKKHGAHILTNTHSNLHKDFPFRQSFRTAETEKPGQKYG